jgi:hypothetical protein
MVLCRLVRTTQSDIYDLAWSPSSRELCSVSVDSKVAVWDVTGEKSPLLSTFTSHSNYVQGACWDPADEFLVSQSNDRSCRVYVRKEVRGRKKKRKKKKGEEGGKEGKEEAAPPTEWVEQGLLRLACREEGGGEEEEEAGREISKLVPVASSTPVVSEERNAGQGHRGEGHGGGKRDDHVTGEHAPALTQAGTPVGKEGEEKKPEETGAVETEVSGVGQEGEEGRQGTMEGEVKERGEEGPLPGQGGKPASKRTPRLHLFADETVPSFFRRPAWSPDGCLLLTPTGLLPPSGHRGGPEGGNKAGGGSAPTRFATHVYARGAFAKPVLELPHPGGKASVVVRFCPQLFALKTQERKDLPSLPPSLPPSRPTSFLPAGTPAGEEKTEPSPDPPPFLTNLPYRMVFAVLTVGGIYVYDTQHHFPLAVVKNSHYAPLTDAAWVNDGSALVVTSMDGYVTVVCLPEGELGAKLELEKVPGTVQRVHGAHYDGIKREAEEREEEEEEEEREERERRSGREKVREEEEKRKARRQQEEAEEEEKRREAPVDRCRQAGEVIDVCDSEKEDGMAEATANLEGPSGEGEEGRKDPQKGRGGRTEEAGILSDSESLHSEEVSEEEDDEGNGQKEEAGEGAVAGEGAIAEESDDEWEEKRMAVATGTGTRKGEHNHAQEKGEACHGVKRKSDEGGKEEGMVQELGEKQAQGKNDDPQSTLTPGRKTRTVPTASPIHAQGSPSAAPLNLSHSSSDSAVSSAQKKKRIRPTPVGENHAAEVFAAAAGVGEARLPVARLMTDEGSRSSCQGTGVLKEANRGPAAAPLKIAEKASNKPVKKRLAPTLISSSLS